MPRTTVTHALAATTLALALSAVACGNEAKSDGGRAEVSATKHNAADVEFASEMLQHHAQALSMVDLTLGRPLDPDVQGLAEQVRAAQAPEIETFTDWLTDWDEEIPETVRDHANAGHDDGHDSMEGMDTDMPGMMSGEDMAALADAPDGEFETMWLEMMIEHHEGAVEMAQAQTRGGQFAPAVELADDIIASQTAEIETMEELLGSATWAGDRSEVAVAGAAGAVGQHPVAALELAAYGAVALIGQAVHQLVRIVVTVVEEPVARTVVDAPGVGVALGQHAAVGPAGEPGARVLGAGLDQHRVAHAGVAGSRRVEAKCSPSMVSVGVSDISCGQRRGQVDERHRARRAGPGRDAWSADHERHVEDLVGEPVLAGEAVLAQRVAVVGGEDDVGVVELAGALERGDGVRDGLVDGEQRTDPGEVELASAGGLRASARPLTTDSLSRMSASLKLRVARRPWGEPGQRVGVRRLGRRDASTAGRRRRRPWPTRGPRCVARRGWRRS